MSPPEPPPDQDDWFAPGAGPDDSVDGLSVLPLLSELEPAHLGAILARTTLATCFDGELLVQSGREAEAVFFLVEGSVRVGGRTFGPGAIVGELGLVDALSWDSTAISVGPSSLRRLGRRAFDDLLQSDPDAGLALLQGIARRLSRALQSLASEGPRVSEAATSISGRRLELRNPAFGFLARLERLDTVAGMPRGLRERLTEGSHEVRLADGDVLFRSNGLVDSIFLVVWGAVRTTATTPAGEVELAVQGPGAWLGSSAFVREQAHTSTATARGDTSVLRIPVSTIGPLWSSRGPDALLFTRALARHLLATLQHRLARGGSGGSAWPPEDSMDRPPDSSGAPQDSMSTRLQSRPNATARVPPVLVLDD